MRLLLSLGVLSMTLFASSCNSAKDKRDMSPAQYNEIVTRIVTKPADMTDLFPKTPAEVNRYVAMATQVARQELAEILAIPKEQRTFDNLVRALDESQAKMYRVDGAISFLDMVSPDDALRNACHEATDVLSKFSVDTYMIPQLYNAFVEYSQYQGKTEQLTDEERYTIDEAMKSFKRSGFDLPADKFAQVKELSKEISTLGLMYSQNIATDATTIKVAQADLDGIDASLMQSLKKDGDLYILGCDYPTYFEVMANCNIRKTRQEMYYAFNNRAYPKNVELLNKIIAKRDEMAHLLGFASYSALETSNCMAKTPERVQSFLVELTQAAGKKYDREIEMIKKELPSGIDLDEDGKLYPWDMSYLFDAYQKKHFNIDERILAEYFPMEKAVQGMFDIYQEFLSLQFKMVKPDWSWHPDVQLIEVHDKETKKLLGYIFLDLYPRDNKYSHACCGAVIQGVRKKNVVSGEREDVPYVGIVLANFPKATAGKPSLLKHEDVQTFFHEFGHAIHGVLGRTELAGNAGTATKTDFVELPSQMLEEWMWDKEMLAKVSSHYKTGASLPEELIKNKIALKNFDTGLFVIRQVMLSQLALEYYLDGADKDTDKILRQVQAQLTGRHQHFDPKNHFQASFGHLIGYGSKYYGYMWSRVFALDIFTEIKKHGLLNYEIGKKWRNIVLGYGGSKDPNELLVEFLGREPRIDAFIEYLGLNKD